MRTVGERLQQVLEEEEFTQTTFGTATGWGQSYVSGLLSNKKPLGINAAKKVLKAVPNLSLNWLFFEIGDMRISPESNTSEFHYAHEPKSEYHADPMEEVFVSYIEKEAIKEIITKIVDKRIKSIMKRQEISAKQIVIPENLPKEDSSDL